MWRTLDHTADAALEIEAASWPELLAEAARAFGEWTSGGGAPNPGETAPVKTVSGRAAPGETERLIEVHGDDRVETWVCFWRALHRLWTVEGLLALHAHVDPASAEGSVSARVGCVAAGTLDPSRCIDVKAVTWHAATAEEHDGRWRGVIVLDL
jgi:SHS2 domain-containing protein